MDILLNTRGKQPLNVWEAEEWSLFCHIIQLEKN